MPKVLSMAGLVVSALVFLVFFLDLVLGIPFGEAQMFGGANNIMNVCCMVAGGILGYLSWSTWRETV